MFTLFIIIVVVAIICSAGKKDKKSEEDLARIEEETQRLPDLYFRMHEMTSTQRALNLFPGDKDILEILKYNAATRNITLKMKDGRSVTCLLSELYVIFSKTNGLYRFEIRHGKTRFSFYKFAYVFTDKEWDVIINVLTLAGETTGIDIFGSTYKNMTRVNTVLKIIKAIS